MQKKMENPITFLGTGMIWDKEKNRVLCRFDKRGEFTTWDEKVAQKLRAMRVPFKDALSVVISEKEYAVNVLQERIDVLEKENADLRAQIEKFVATEDEKFRYRTALKQKLTDMGVSFKESDQTVTLEKKLKKHEEKEAAKEKESVEE